MAETPLQTRARLEQAIRDGGSVLLADGRQVLSIEDLPTVLELAAAAGDPEAEADAKAALQAKIDDLQAQLDKAGAKPDDTTPATGTKPDKK